LQRLKKKNITILVLNVFDQGDKRALKEYEIRGKEDRRALEILNIECASLNLLDGPFRDSIKQRDGRLLFGSAEEDSQTLPEVIKRLQHKLEILKPSVVIAPLGVGWHLDHLIVHSAALKVCDPSRLRFYADCPYSLVPGQTELRIGMNRSHIKKKFCENILQAPYVQSFLPDWNEAKFESLLSEQIKIEKGTQFRHSLTINLSYEEAGVSQSAALQYQSQVSGLFGNVSDFRRMLMRRPEEYYKL
jgi:LmbE family N-acetylglucosaminyl deacetylase